MEDLVKIMLISVVGGMAAAALTYYLFARSADDRGQHEAGVIQATMIAYGLWSCNKMRGVQAVGLTCLVE